MTERIKGIQNKQKSLMWGSAAVSATETLFAVGHKSYPKSSKFFVVRYFEVTSSYSVVVVDDYTNKELYVRSNLSEDEVVKEVLELLKKWFPAKGGTTSE